MGGKRWTKEDEKFLTDNWGRLKVETLAKRLKRTPKAITSKASLLGLGVRMTWYGTQEVAEILGIHKKTAYKYMVEGKIKSFRDKTTKDKATRSRIMANEKSLMTFMRDYPDLWDSRRVSIQIFERDPAWLKEKKLKDKDRSSKNRKKWSELDTKILIDRYNRGWSVKEIAKETGRSVRAVENRLFIKNYGINFKF